MLRFRPEARVGLVIFIGLLALILMYWFLGGVSLRARTYPIYAVFRNIQRLSEGAEVRMAGVPIGRVSRISLWRDSRAQVEMVIRQDVRIPAGSEFRVTSGGLVGDVYVDIVPAQPNGNYLEPGQVVFGEDTITLDQVLPQVSELLVQLQGTAEGLSKVFGDEQTQATMRRTLANAELASEQAAALAADLRRIAARSGQATERVLANAIRATEDFALMARDLRRVVDTGGAEDIAEILQRGRQTVANLEEASDSLAELVGDPQLAEDVAATAENFRVASEEARAITERLSGLVGARRRDPARRVTVPDMGWRFDALANLSENKYRLNLNVVVPTAEDHFYRAGLYDIGESIKLNLQAGRMLGSSSALRYGLYASRPGVGYDRFFGDRGSIHADFFRPNDPQLELKALYNLNSNVGLWIGVDDLLDESSLILGAQYRR